jgi:hypothetical protein
MKNKRIISINEALKTFEKRAPNEIANNLEQIVYRRIFAIDYGSNSKFDGKRLDAAQDISKDIMGFMAWYSGMSEEKILKAIERYVQEKNPNK